VGIVVGVLLVAVVVIVAVGDTVGMLPPVTLKVIGNPIAAVIVPCGGCWNVISHRVLPFIASLGMFPVIWNCAGNGVGADGVTVTHLLQSPVIDTVPIITSWILSGVRETSKETVLPAVVVSLYRTGEMVNALTPLTIKTQTTNRKKRVFIMLYSPYGFAAPVTTISHR
jgi:hypothetical protein